MASGGAESLALRRQIADHWAIAVPIARTHETIGSMFVTENAYPREALLEALLRFLEEDLETPPEPVTPGW